MSQQERINIILSQLEERGQMSVPDICTLFGISKDTARRDIVRLVEMELVERFRGGIRKPFLRPRLEAYRSRLIRNSKIKKLLGKAAAQLVCDNDTVMLDLSTTVQFAGESISAENVLAVTNSIDTAIALMETKVERIYLTGGFLYPKTNALLGMAVLDRVKDFHFDIVFIGATAIRPDGIYYTQQDDVVLKKNIMQTADKIVLVADHTKFFEISPHRMDFSGIHVLITDRRPPDELMEVLNKHCILVMVVDEENRVSIQK